MGNLKWLEVLHNVVQTQIKSKEDCLVTVLHCIMINKGNKCVGTGDSWDQSSDKPSELLPESWNSNQEIYTLRYSLSPEYKYLMKIVKINNSLLVNLLDVDNSKAAGMSVLPDDFINDDFHAFSTAYKNLGKMEKNFEDNISKTVKLPHEAPDNSKKRSYNENSIEHDDPLIEERYSYPYASSDPHPQIEFPSVGSNDLNPLGGFFGGPGRGGGGMLVDPSSMGRNPHMPDLGIGGPGPLPRGAIPPGARFDPLGPPNRGRGPRPSFSPDPDIMPPGFSDSFI